MKVSYKKFKEQEMAVSIVVTLDSEVLEEALIKAKEQHCDLSEYVSRLVVRYLKFRREMPSSAAYIDASSRLPPDGIDLEELENSVLQQALDLSDNNQSAAARPLGISRAKFRTLLKRTELAGSVQKDPQPGGQKTTPMLERPAETPIPNNP
jgi:DNA-binding NtrC family response regulator